MIFSGGFIPTPVGNTHKSRSVNPVTTVHPHARGEHPGVELASSSVVRFIPTPVGNTRQRPSCAAGTTVHPHARGEHSRSPTRRAQTGGSSPRPWGTQVTRGDRLCHVRFIPTPVGNTNVTNPYYAPLPVHPHARGEHAMTSIWYPRHSGSSPRPWGTRVWRGFRAGRGRFIPTPVGNTAATSTAASSAAVHPHARGEHSFRRVRLPEPLGSSPRPWGTQHVNLRSQPLKRFIPTPVGNTGVNARVIRLSAVHPHARGEHSAVRFRARGIAGSSPRPWGTLAHHVEDVHRGRFIPTPVGNTFRCLTY